MTEIPQNESSDELRDLLAEMVDGEPSPDQSHRLAELIRDDVEARTNYLEHCRMHASLAWEHGVLEGLSLEKSEAEEEVNSKRRIISPFTLAAAAAIGLLAVLSWQVVGTTIQRTVWASGEIIGEVGRSAEAELRVSGSNLQLMPEDKLRPGEYELSGGLIQLLLENQVQLLIEAPARFRLRSSSLMTLKEGRLTANVPPEGVGFTVDTPDAEVVDYGTKFGVEVSEGIGSEVHVFEGEVGVKTSLDTQDPVHLFANEATRINRGGLEPSGVLVAPDRFFRSFDEPARNYSRHIRNLDPAVYYRMPIREDGSTLLDKSGNERNGRVERGTMDALPFAPGRIGSALALKGSSRQAFGWVDHYPEVTSNKLTVMAWVYAESRPRWANIVSHGSGAQPGQFRFCLNKDRGGLYAIVQQADGQVAKVMDPEPLPLGTWQHIAFVADGETLLLYRNGKEVSRVFQSELLMASNAPLVIGARISSREKSDGFKGVEIWDGRIDELSVFHRALSADQINQLYSSTDQ